MSLYAVILKQPDAVAWEKIRERWPDYHYFLSETAAFVAATGISTTEQIRDEIGLNLESLEKRVDGLEDDVKKLLVDTTEIKAKMPTQATVYSLFGGALVLNFVALVGHLLIRTLSP